MYNECTKLYTFFKKLCIEFTNCVLLKKLYTLNVQTYVHSLNVHKLFTFFKKLQSMNVWDLKIVHI